MASNTLVSPLAPLVGPSVDSPAGEGADIQRGRAVPHASKADISLESVYSEHFRFVWRCMRSLGVPDSTVDDAVQEVFLVVNRRLGEFAGELRPWLYAIVRRIAMRYRKRALTEGSRFLSENSADPSEMAGRCSSDMREEVEARERLSTAQRALECLDESKREVFVFCVIEGLSAPEIAQIVGAPLNTVYSRLRLARQEFATTIARMQGEESRRLPSGRARKPALATRLFGRTS